MMGYGRMAWDCGKPLGDDVGEHPKNLAYCCAKMEYAQCPRKLDVKYLWETMTRLWHRDGTVQPQVVGSGAGMLRLGAGA